MKKYSVFCFNGPISIASYYHSCNDIKGAFFSTSQELQESEGSFAMHFDTKEERSAFMQGAYYGKLSEKDSIYAVDEMDVPGDEKTPISIIPDDSIDTCWFQFCKKYYPEFDRSNLVKEDSELYKYLENDASDEIVRKIESMKYDSKEDLVRELVRLETTMFKTALEEYYKKRYKIRGL